MYYVFPQIEDISNSTTYNLTIDVSEVPPYTHTIQFTIDVNIDTHMPTTAAASVDGIDMTIVIAVIVLGAVVIIALVVLIVVCWRKRKAGLAADKRGIFF